MTIDPRPDHRAPPEGQGPEPHPSRFRFDSHYTLTALREYFDWKRVLVGLVLIVGGNIGAYFALRGLFAAFVGAGRVLAAAVLMAGVSLGVYFVGGLVVGRLSSGRTVKEPAVAAVLALVVIFLLQLRLGMFNIVGLVVGAPFCFGVAYLGGWLGEKWKTWARRR